MILQDYHSSPILRGGYYHSLSIPHSVPSYYIAPSSYHIMQSVYYIAQSSYHIAHSSYYIAQPYYTGILFQWCDP